MGKSEDKVKYKSNKKGTAMMIVGIAVVVLLVVFIIFGTSITDFFRNVFSKSADDASSGDEISSSATDTGDSGSQTDGDESSDNGYPENETQLSPDYQLAAPTAGDPIAIINTSLGTMKFKLFPENAPKAVENFSTKAKAGYYDGMKFINLYEDVLQSDGDMDTIYGEGFEREFSINLHNYLGALGVCNSGEGNTSSNQFYIVTQKEVADDIIEAMSGEQAQSLGLGFSQEVIGKYDTFGGDPTLDGQFAVFGQMYEGLEVIDLINAVQVDDNYTPLQDITITSIEIGTY